MIKSYQNVCHLTEEIEHVDDVFAWPMQSLEKMRKKQNLHKAQEKTGKYRVPAKPCG